MGQQSAQALSAAYLDYRLETSKIVKRMRVRSNDVVYTKPDPKFDIVDSLPDDSSTSCYTFFPPRFREVYQPDYYRPWERRNDEIEYYVLNGLALPQRLQELRLARSRGPPGVSGARRGMCQSVNGVEHGEVPERAALDDALQNGALQDGVAGDITAADSTAQDSAARDDAAQPGLNQPGTSQLGAAYHRTAPAPLRKCVSHFPQPGQEQPAPQAPSGGVFTLEVSDQVVYERVFADEQIELAASRSSAEPSECSDYYVTEQHAREQERRAPEQPPQRRKSPQQAPQPQQQRQPPHQNNNNNTRSENAQPRAARQRKNDFTALPHNNQQIDDEIDGYFKIATSEEQGYCCFCF